MGRIGCIGFRVYDFKGNNVTDNYRWFIDTHEHLYIFDGYLHSAEGSYYYSMK